MFEEVTIQTQLHDDPDISFIPEVSIGPDDVRMVHLNPDFQFSGQRIVIVGGETTLLNFF